MANVVRTAPLLRTCLEVLAEADEPLTASEVIERIEQRRTFTPYECASVDKDGTPRWKNHLGWVSGDVATVGWMTKRNGRWALTEAGANALDEYDAEQLNTEKNRLFAEIRKRREQAAEALSGSEQLIARMLSLTNPGSWTTFSDLAAIAKVSPEEVGHFLAGGKKRKPGAYRVLDDGGRDPGDGMLHFGYRGIDRRKELEKEGVVFDEHGRPDPEQQITADDFRERLAALDTPVRESQTVRAWLVRGSSVEGRDLIPVWLKQNSMSLAAASLRPIVPPVSRAELKSYVEEDYAFMTLSATRTVKLDEFDLFCNHMQPGDFVLTMSNGKAYVGRITGEASYAVSTDQRSNLRRPVEWLNATQPVVYGKLPAPLPAKLHNQNDVVELTEELPAIEKLLAELGIEQGEESPKVRRELTFPEIPESLADELLTSRYWLQRQADLLWDRRQLIFYGPPGTGKTFLAHKLATALTEPSAVKLVQFHPSYTYEDFIEGLRPKPDDEGRLLFEPHSGPFLDLVEAARQHPADPYVLIVDEINRANLAKVFGELYFLLEYRDHSISLLYSSKKDFTLPPNVFLIGTMNTTDRSIALVDAAMRRRFAFVELHPGTEPTDGLLRKWIAQRDDVEHNADTPELLEALNARIADRDLAIGPSYFMRGDIYRRPDGLQTVWDTSIMPLLAEYHYGSPVEILEQYRLDVLRKALGSES
ncbi:AAA family ATPase [Saccharopolyspora cebuensis]|uniref:AAA family ATPase n=1 Tax=Saccharopolyspora cebuensis TaxID=418759 RepID=A0ABV4CIU9_9PSEU